MQTFPMFAVTEAQDLINALSTSNKHILLLGVKKMKEIYILKTRNFNARRTPDIVICWPTPLAGKIKRERKNIFIVS